VKSNKPYKSLKDVYSENVNGHVAPRRHLRVLGEAQVDITYDGGETDVIGDVDNKKASSIADYLRGEAEGSIMLTKDFEVIQGLARASGFPKMERFLKYLFMGFNDIDYGGLQELVNEKDGLKALGPHLTQSKGKVDLWEICLPQIKRFLKNKEDWGLFYNMLFVKDFKEGNVSVGAGELALAVLTEAKKGTYGDLEIGNLQIELKSGMGRVLSARQQGFADDWRRILEIITNDGVRVESEEPGAEPVYTLDFDAKSFWNNKYAKNILTKDNLETVLKRKKDLNDRKQYVGALLLYQYGIKDPNGFDILLAVYQHGKEANLSRMEAEFVHRVEAGQDNRDKKGQYAKGIPGTWWDANYVNVANLENIFKAVDSGLIKFQFGGEGVSIFYPGSSSTAAGPAGEKYQTT